MVAAEPDGWKERIDAFRSRGLFHALCDYRGPDVWGDLLGWVAQRPWFAELATALTSVSAVAGTHPWEEGDDELLGLLWDLYALGRVRDALLLGHQPPPLDPRHQHETDIWLHREEPSFDPVPVEWIVDFFGHLGGRPVSEARFDPILHEIVVCEPADRPDHEITVLEELWPALLVGELVFARAGVRVSAGSDRARPGVADRSTLHGEYWRRHRPTIDLSMGWGSNSQWRTSFRRDYLTSSGRVYNFDALAPSTQEAAWADRGLRTSGAQVEALVRNRCSLVEIDPQEEQLWPYDTAIDER